MSEWQGTWFRCQERLYPLEMVLEKRSRHDLRPHRDGERAVGSFILPPFQRPPVWSMAQKARLIESFLDGLPVPAYVANKDIEGDMAYDRWLLDGQQRVTAVVEFLSDAYPVRGIRFSEAPQRDRRWFLNRPWVCLETELRDEALLSEVYDRLAYGGTPHERKD